MKETCRFVWNKSYSVNNEEIDHQHRTMFDIANTLPDRIDDPSVKTIIIKLYGYVLTHLLEEERLMNEKEYPKLSEHSRIHGRLIAKLNRIISEGINTSEELHALKKFIYEWTSHHILHEDKRFANFVQSTEFTNGDDFSKKKPDMG